MNEIYAANAKVASGSTLRDCLPPSRTIGENIDARIATLNAEIKRLEGVRDQLQSGASLLDVRIEDLRQAMNY